MGMRRVLAPSRPAFAAPYTMRADLRRSGTGRIHSAHAPVGSREPRGAGSSAVEWEGITCGSAFPLLRLLTNRAASACAGSCSCSMALNPARWRWFSGGPWAAATSSRGRSASTGSRARACRIGGSCAAAELRAVCPCATIGSKRGTSGATRRTERSLRSRCSRRVAAWPEAPAVAVPACPHW